MDDATKGRAPPSDSTPADGARSAQDAAHAPASACGTLSGGIAAPAERPGISPAAPPRLEIQTSRQFTAWLAAEQLSLAFTTYQGGKVFFLGLKPDGGLEVFNRTFERCMGLSVSSQTLWFSSLYQLWRFENLLEPGQHYQGYDRVYVPQVAYATGDVDIHDVAMVPPAVGHVAAAHRGELAGQAVFHRQAIQVTAVLGGEFGDESRLPQGREAVGLAHRGETAEQGVDEHRAAGELKAVVKDAGTGETLNRLQF